MKIDCIIPVRLNSRRLRKKHLRVIDGKPAIQWAIDALKKSRLIHNIVLCFSYEENYDAWESIQCMKMKIRNVHPEDVCGRLNKCAELLHTHTAILWSGDCFICDPDIIDDMIIACLTTKKTIISDMEGAIVSPIEHWREELNGNMNQRMHQFPGLLEDKERCIKLSRGSGEKVSVDTLDELINVRELIRNKYGKHGI